MEFFDKLYFTFYSITYLVPGLYFGFISIQLFNIQNKKPASANLAVGFTFLTLYALFAFLSTCLIGSELAKLRLIAELFIIPFCIHLTAFFLHYPGSILKSFSRFYLIASWLLYIILVILVFWATANTNYQYNFNTHFWDISDHEIYWLISSITILMVSLVFALSLWRSFTNKEYKKYLFRFSIIILFCLLIPIMINFLSKEILLSKSLTTIIINILSIIGTFLFFDTYLISSGEKFSYSNRILSLIFLIIFSTLEVLAYISIQEKKESYTELKKKLLSQEILFSKRSTDLLYIKEYYHIIEQIRYTYNKNIEQGSFSESNLTKQELSNSYHIYIILKLLELSMEKPSYRTLAFEYLQETDLFFNPYKDYIQNYLNTTSISKESIQELKSELIKLKTALIPYRTRFQKLPTKDFRKHISKFLDHSIERLIFFNQSVKEHVQNTDFKNEKLKEQALLYLADFYFLEELYFHLQNETDKRIVSFLFIDPEEQKLYELGYDYIDYRKNIHETAITYIVITLFMMIFINVLFRRFLAYSFIRNTETLWKGMHSIIKADYSNEIPIYSLDEFGYLTTSLNEITKKLELQDIKKKKEIDRLEIQFKESVEELSKLMSQLNSSQYQKQTYIFSITNSIDLIKKMNDYTDNLIIEHSYYNHESILLRGKNYSLPNDIFIYRKIILNNQEHTMIISAASLGKTLHSGISIALFSYYISAFLDNQAKKFPYPESFLKYLVEQLEEHLADFKISYKLSFLFGILSKENDFYYIRSAYPAPLIYKDSTCELLSDQESDVLKMKYGKGKKVNINAVHLSANTCLFLGTESKDKTMYNFNSIQVESLDNDRITEIIESSEGKVDIILERLILATENKFDISILKIQPISNQYNYDWFSVEEIVLKFKDLIRNGENYKAGLVLEDGYSKYPNSIEILKNLSYYYLSNKNYHKSAQYSEKYIELYPTDNEYLYAVSYNFKKAKNFSKAVYYGERLLLREPEDIKNLCNLMESHYLAENYERARELYRIIQKIDPENPILDSQKNN